jgi:hypothetical protein
VPNGVSDLVLGFDSHGRPLLLEQERELPDFPVSVVHAVMERSGEKGRTQSPKTSTSRGLTYYSSASGKVSAWRCATFHSPSSRR